MCMILCNILHTCNIFYACSVLYTCLYGIFYISFIYIQSYTCNHLYHTLQFVIYKIHIGKQLSSHFHIWQCRAPPSHPAGNGRTHSPVPYWGIPQFFNGWENGRGKWEGLSSCSRKIGGENGRGKWEGPFSCSSKIGWENRWGKWEGKLGGAIFLYPYNWKGPLPSCTCRYGNVRMTVCPRVDIVTFYVIWKILYAKQYIMFMFMYSNIYYVYVYMLFVRMTIHSWTNSHEWIFLLSM